MAKKKKKRVLKVKNIIILLCVFGIFVGGCYYILSMPIKNIYISGNNNVSDEEILTLLELDEYPSFLLYNKSNVEKNIINNKYINDISIDKKIGNIVQVEVVENSIIALDLDGRVILSNGDVVYNKYNVLDVPRLMSHIDNDKIIEFARKFSNINNDILRQISEVEYSPLLVDSDRFLLYMCDGNFVYVTLTKIDKLNKYNDIKDELIDKKGIIYLDSGDYVEIKG